MVDIKTSALGWWEKWKLRCAAACLKVALKFFSKILGVDAHELLAYHLEKRGHISGMSTKTVVYDCECRAAMWGRDDTQHHVGGIK